MRSFFILLLLCMFSFKVSICQDIFLLDSTAHFRSFLDNVTIKTAKYEYDDQFRILSVRKSEKTFFYEYLNELDYYEYVHSANDPNGHERILYLFDEDGLLLEKRYDYKYATFAYRTFRRLVCRYNSYKQLIDEKVYDYNFCIDGMLYSHFTIEYENGNPSTKFDTSFTSANCVSAISKTTRIEYFFEDSLLIAENEFISDDESLIKSLHKTLFYNEEDHLDSVSFLEIVQQDTIDIDFTTYEYDPAGFLESQYSRNIELDTNFRTKDIYSSYSNSLFYDFDTISFQSYHNNEPGFAKEIKYHEFYFPSGDSVVIRKEDHITVFDLFIDKELYIKKSVLNAIDEVELPNAGIIYPNPSKSGETVIIDLEIDNVNRIQLFNMVGQSIQRIESQNRNQIILQAPSIPGIYQVVYFEDDKQVARTGRFVVK